jgi:hypothetical protein
LILTAAAGSARRWPRAAGNDVGLTAFPIARMAIAEPDFGNIYNLLAYPGCCIANLQAVV